MVPSRDRTREETWIDENRAAYTDQWVAEEGDRLIAAGVDPLRVFADAKERGVQTPFVVHVLPEDPLALRAWLVRMPVSLAFDTSHHCAETADGINVPITSVSAAKSVDSLRTAIHEGRM